MPRLIIAAVLGAVFFLVTVNDALSFRGDLPSGPPLPPACARCDYPGPQPPTQPGTPPPCDAYGRHC